MDQLVQTVVVPKLLTVGDLSDDGADLSAGKFSAEQAAMTIHIQAHAESHSDSLVKSLDLPVLTPETIQAMMPILSATSSVTHPRIHLFWDAFVSYITEPTETTSAIQVRKFRSSCPVGDVMPVDLINAVFQHVVLGSLLGVRDGKQEAKTTHDRGALCLCIIRNLAGVEFVSSLSGRTRLEVDAEMMEHVILQPMIVKHLFMQIMGAGIRGGKNHAPHLLRPLAVQVLESLTETIGAGEDAVARRLAIIRPLLLCDPRFDSKAKVALIDQLLMMKGDKVEIQPSLWNQHLEFLETQVLKAAAVPIESKSSSSVSHYDAQGYADMIFQCGRVIAVCKSDTTENLEYKANKTRSVLAFLLAAAFYDCNGVSSSPVSSKKKKAKKPSKRSAAVEAACLIKLRRCEVGVLPYQLRSTLSSRFYSLVAETTGSTMHSTAKNRDEQASELLSYLSSACQDLELAGAKRFESDSDGIHESQEHDSPQVALGALHKLERDIRESKAEASMQKFATSCSILGTTLYLNLLDCGSAESMEEEDLDSDAENDADEVKEFISGLFEVCSLFLKQGSAKEEVDPMVSMTDLCAAILSSPIATGSQNKGGFPRLLRETVKSVWVSALSFKALKDSEALSPDVYSILLRSIGIEDDETMNLDEDESDDSEDDSDAGTVGDSDDSGDVFAKAVHDPDVLDDTKDKLPEENHVSEDDESDVEINPDRLRTFLEEDSDADVDENELEHHEGADAALAKLIRIKQEARKAGQMARERIEMSKHLRSSILLETLLNGKPDGWGALLRTEYVLEMSFSMLRYRRELERSLVKAGKMEERRGMAEKITTLLKTKLFKLKHTDRQWIEPSKSGEVCTTIAANILSLMKGNVSKEQRSCCSLGLVALVRSAPDAPAKVEIGAIYNEITEEWSNKRTTRLESDVLEDFIQLCPIVAQTTLCAPLAAVVASTRSSYLRIEASRLLALLYNPNLNPMTSEFEKDASDTVRKSLDPTLEAFTVALADAETKKSKRGKEIMRALAKILSFVTAISATVPTKLTSKLKVQLEKLRVDTESHPLEDACNKLLKQVEELEASQTENAPPPVHNTDVNPADDGDDDSGSEDEAVVGKASKKTKSKKKKGKLSKKKRK